MLNKRSVGFGSMALLLLCGLVQAEISIHVGNHEVFPNRAGQVIRIPVTRDAGDVVQGLNLLVQVGDGGSVLGGTDGNAPRITGVDLLGQTIFGPNSNGNNVVTQTGKFWEVSTTTLSGTVDPEGTLVSITLDTTGISDGAFDLKLAGILGQLDTDFAGLRAEITNGQILVVPEPTGLLFLGLGGLSWWGRRRVPEHHHSCVDQ